MNHDHHDRRTYLEACDACSTCKVTMARHERRKKGGLRGHARVGGNARFPIACQRHEHALRTWQAVTAEGLGRYLMAPTSPFLPTYTTATPFLHSVQHRYQPVCVGSWWFHRPWRPFRRSSRRKAKFHISLFPIPMRLPTTLELRGSSKPSRLGP